MELKEIDKIEIRSEEVQDILGATPSWIIRAGISVILLVVVALLIGSWFFKYPDIIQSSISLTTQNPPASLKAMSSGKITKVFVTEKQDVQKEEVIAIIENTANFNDVLALDSLLKLFKLQSFGEGVNFNLGDIQQSYSSYNRLLKAYQNFKDLDYYNKKVESINQQREIINYTMIDFGHKEE